MSIAVLKPPHDPPALRCHPTSVAIHLYDSNLLGDTDKDRSNAAAYCVGVFDTVAALGASGLRRFLYQILESVTRLRFPDHDESDSTWRTTEVRHVGSNTFAWGFQGVSATRLGEEDQRWPPGATASGSCGDL